MFIRPRYARRRHRITTNCRHPQHDNYRSSARQVEPPERARHVTSRKAPTDRDGVYRWVFTAIFAREPDREPPL